MKIKNFIYLVCCLFFVLAVTGGISFAAETDPETPTVLKGGKIISADEAKSLVDKKEAVLFDFRSAINFGKGHIPKAVILPYKGKSPNTPDVTPAQDEFDAAKLPSDKNANIVFYSDGPKGWKSYKAALIAIKIGYKNVMWFRGGFNEWTEKGYPIEQ
ncbi:MAG: rhodanese-like domain-containing protein [Deltaproteobacteria bacterium]|nr:rhodanese-like domain-containing protein [Deltaproteobacteria bacterium]